ncbi:response regulator transcription factor [Chitinophaga sp. GbtcB8]|uniref:response regulator transcription factor n=1 Tax=Chitinophaga sp. GbtcB8 TaxID=2824753 RepID=UPI001C30119D|nr:response regulator transcription factor [Chitinophaga sp. GbtcB8]
MKKVRRDNAGHLNGTDILEVAGIQSDDEQILQQLAKDICNIVFMDVEIPGVSAVEAANILKAAYPDINVLLLTVHRDSHSLASLPARTTTADEPINPPALTGFVSRVYDTAVQTNLTAIQKVLAYFHHRAQHDISQYGLSPREQEVLDRLVDGHTYKKIAELCHISVGTVRSHIMNIYRKLEVNSRSAAIVKAMRG